MLGAPSTFLVCRKKLAIAAAATAQPKSTVADLQGASTVAVPVRENHTKTIDCTVMNAVREQRSKEVAYTVTEIVHEQRVKTDPITGDRLEYTVAYPVRKLKTKTVNYTVTLMVPDRKQKTIEHQSLRKALAD